MKRLLLLFVICMGAVSYMSSAPIKYRSCTPAEGSKIESWDFELEFDISEALKIAESVAPGKKYGLGYRGSGYLKAYLYKGDYDSMSEPLGESMDRSFTGKSVGFVPGGNKVKFSFPKTIPIEKDEKYTIEILNTFYLFAPGESVYVKETESEFTESPIVLTFTGADMTGKQIFINGSSLTPDEPLETLREVYVYLSDPFDVAPGTKISLTEKRKYYTEVTNMGVTSDIKVSDSDDKVAVVRFGKDMVLRNGYEYSVVIPEGTFTIKGSPQYFTPGYSVTVPGSRRYHVAVTSVTPKESVKDRLKHIEIKYALDSKFTMTPPTSSSGNSFTAMLYEGDMSDESKGVKVGGGATADGKGVVWDLSLYRYKPSTKYYLKKSPDLTIFDVNGGGSHNEYYSDEVIISWETPSFEESGLAPMVFNLPTLSSTNYGDEKAVYSEGMERAYIGGFTIDLKDKFYYDSDITYDMAYRYVGVTLPHNLEVYEILPEGDRLIKVATLGEVWLQDSRYMWKGMQATGIDLPLYEGKTYRLVIPEESLTVLGRDGGGMPTIHNLEDYVQNDRMEFIVKGKTKPEFKVLSCSVEDNSKHYSLNNVIWELEGTYRSVTDELTALERRVPEGAISFGGSVLTTHLYHSSGNTYVFVDRLSFSKGVVNFPIQYSGYSEFVVKAGLLVNTVNEDIVNEELKVRVYGMSLEEYEESLYANVTVTLRDESGMPSSIVAMKSAKDKAATITLTTDPNWEVAYVTHNDSTVTATGGVYTSEPLKEDARIDATLRFKHDVTFADFVSGGVDKVTGAAGDISIRKDGDTVIVDGLKGGEQISVYSLGGTLIRKTEVGAGMDSTRISLPSDSVVLLLVESTDGKQAFKVKL